MIIDVEAREVEVDDRILLPVRVKSIRLSQSTGMVHITVDLSGVEESRQYHPEQNVVIETTRR